MIISHKYKYIFVGLPFSASSAISKELIEQYDGEPILEKHSNAFEIRKKTNLNINEYKVFACIRDPYDIAKSRYAKFKNNPNGVYETKEYFKENGGHIAASDRRWFSEIQNGLTLEGFLAKKYKLPVDTLYSLNHNYLDYVINFNDLNTSFRLCLEKIGIQPKRDLPLFNKTNKKEESVNVKSSYPKSFRPFLAVYGHLLGVHVSCDTLNILFFKILRSIRIQYWRYRFMRMKHDVEAYKNDRYYYNVSMKNNSQ